MLGFQVPSYLMSVSRLAVADGRPDKLIGVGVLATLPGGREVGTTDVGRTDGGACVVGPEPPDDVGVALEEDELREDDGETGGVPLELGLLDDWL